jgi:hypothetical protein
MSKKNSRYSYGDFHFSLVDAKGSEYPVFDPSDPYGIGGTYDVCIDTWQYDYQNKWGQRCPRFFFVSD